MPGFANAFRTHNPPEEGFMASNSVDDQILVAVSALCSWPGREYGRNLSPLSSRSAPVAWWPGGPAAVPGADLAGDVLEVVDQILVAVSSWCSWPVVPGHAAHRWPGREYDRNLSPLPSPIGAGSTVARCCCSTWCRSWRRGARGRWPGQVVVLSWCSRNQVQPQSLPLTHPDQGR